MSPAIPVSLVCVRGVRAAIWFTCPDVDPEVGFVRGCYGHVQKATSLPTVLVASVGGAVPA